MNCPDCENKRIIKVGFKQLKSGKIQKYKCTDCDRNFTGQEKYKRSDEIRINLIHKMFEEKTEMRKIARILNISLATVQYQLKKN